MYVTAAQHAAVLDQGMETQLIRVLKLSMLPPACALHRPVIAVNGSLNLQCMCVQCVH
jgi:hypothetical protein